MKTKNEEQSTKELELAHIFEVEELEDRLEFRIWGPTWVDEMLDDINNPNGNIE